MSEATREKPLLSPGLLAQLERMELISRKVFRGRMKGERRSKRQGQSVEFADYRNYVPGDDLRFIDWNLYARLEKLFLKLFLEEEDLHFYALVDASPSMGFGEPTKLEYAKQVAASLGYIGLCRSDRIKIETLGTSHRAPAPVLRGRQSMWRMFDELNKMEPDESVSLLDGVKNFCLRNSGKGIVVVLTDLMEKEGYEQALRLLVSQQMDIYLIHILSEEELKPQITGDLKLVDCEDRDIADVSVSQSLLHRYEATLANFLSGARDFCTKRGIMYLMTSTARPIEQMVSSYLRERGLVR